MRFVVLRCRDELEPEFSGSTSGAATARQCANGLFTPHPQPVQARAVADTSPRYSRDRAGATRRWKLNNILPHGRHPSEKACINCDTPDHLGNRNDQTSQVNPHDHMNRITYRLRTEPIYRTITIILMSHPSLHTHIPECNSSMTHNHILCRSNHPHPSLTTTLSHCIISLLQEKPATLPQPQCTENHN